MFAIFRKTPSKQGIKYEFGTLPTGVLAQAVGDVHGCCNLLKKLLVQLIDQNGDSQTRHLIFLGDLIDRGPDSAEVVETVRAAVALATPERQVIALRGNHEQLLLNFIADPGGVGQNWLSNGGVETLRSYGVFVPNRTPDNKLPYYRDELLRNMPDSHLSFLRGLPLSFELGGYFFCHAAVDPDRAFSAQIEKDLLWSRRMEFLDTHALEKMVVHGHTPVKEPLAAQGHINIDTGAYASGRLTALSMSSKNRHFVEVRG